MRPFGFRRNDNADCLYRRAPWHRRAGQRLKHSIKLRMVAVFLLLAAGMTFVFVSGVQKALAIGWRDAAKPLLADYVSHLAADVVDADGHPSVERAQALTQRVPVTVRINGPVVNWASHPAQGLGWWRPPPVLDTGTRQAVAPEAADTPSDNAHTRFLQRTTADGHTITFGVDESVFERRPRMVVYTLLALLLLTLLAWAYVRRVLRPLDDIGEGARRFGAGDFSLPIPVNHPRHPDELGQLAQTINAMGADIHQMLEAKRALLLAISHELRSPLTRARLHAELLPEAGEFQTQRDGLMRDLHEMSQLISDLLEGERLSGGHAALQREPTDLAALAQDVLAECLSARGAASEQAQGDSGVGTPEAGAANWISLDLPDTPLPLLTLDPTRTRLLLRNLIGNVRRHAAHATQPATLSIRLQAANDTQPAAQGGAPQWLTLAVRDHGPGVPPDQLAQLGQAFMRTDSARTRTSGGVGLGLYLCRLVAQAHGGSLSLRNANPGLEVSASWPVAVAA